MDRLIFGNSKITMVSPYPKGALHLAETYNLEKELGKDNLGLAESLRGGILSKLVSSAKSLVDLVRSA